MYRVLLPSSLRVLSRLPEVPGGSVQRRPELWDHRPSSRPLSCCMRWDLEALQQLLLVVCSLMIRRLQWKRTGLTHRHRQNPPRRLGTRRPGSQIRPAPPPAGHLLHCCLTSSQQDWSRIDPVLLAVGAAGLSIWTPPCVHEDLSPFFHLFTFSSVLKSRI